MSQAEIRVVGQFEKTDPLPVSASSDSLANCGPLGRRSSRSDESQYQPTHCRNSGVSKCQSTYPKNPLVLLPKFAIFRPDGAKIFRFQSRPQRVTLCPSISSGRSCTNSLKRIKNE